MSQTDHCWTKGTASAFLVVGATALGCVTLYEDGEGVLGPAGEMVVCCIIFAHTRTLEHNNNNKKGLEGTHKGRPAMGNHNKAGKSESSRTC